MGYEGIRATQGIPEDGSLVDQAASLGYDANTSADASLGANASIASNVATGSYVGNGSTRAVEGLTFSPMLVVVRADSMLDAVARTSTMVGDQTKDLANGSLASNSITSIDVGGFSLGSDPRVNAAGTTYYWTAFAAIAGKASAGTYLGNGNDDRSILTGGVAPDVVWILSGGSQSPAQRSSTMLGDTTFDFNSGSATSNRIQTLETSGFQVGTSSAVNQAGTTYHFVAWSASPALVSVKRYTGDGVDDRSIAGVGFAPAFVTVKSEASHNGAFRPASVVGDATLFWEGSFDPAADLIQRLTGDGVQLGAHYRVNEAGSVFHLVAFAP